METKKTIFILFLISNAIVGVAQQSLETKEIDSHTISSEGVGDIKVYKTTLKDLKKKCPDCKVESYRESIGFGISTAARAVYIKNEGMYFFLERKKWFGHFYVRSISIDSTFKGKTITGIGIGSTYNDIIAEFGKENIKSLQSGGEEVSFLYYDTSPASITFRCHNIKADTNSFKVDEIYINGWKKSW